MARYSVEVLFFSWNPPGYCTIGKEDLDGSKTLNFIGECRGDVLEINYLDCSNGNTSGSDQDFLLFTHKPFIGKSSGYEGHMLFKSEMYGNQAVLEKTSTLLPLSESETIAIESENNGYYVRIKKN